FLQPCDQVDEMRKDNFELLRRSYHLIHEVSSCLDPFVSFAGNEERADAWLDHVRDNDQKLD
ncbi:hypothetical protein Tco_1267278, partial [Tanacetum coccineum]